MAGRRRASHGSGGIGSRDGRRRDGMCVRDERRVCDPVSVFGTKSETHSLCVV